MAAAPPISAGTAFSAMFSAAAGTGGISMDKSLQFGAMISEIERVRSRFENEKSNSAQFGQQMAMLAQQIESLTNQQSTMLGYHIGRMDLVLKELKTSEESLTKEQQRAAFEVEQRTKFERERETRAQRDRLERERRELMEKLQRQNREREERERREREEQERREHEAKDRRAREEREHREKMQRLHNTSLPSMNTSDIIPKPSRTVTASKRKLSLGLGASHRSTSSSSTAGNPGLADSVSSTQPNKRAKTNPASENNSEDFSSVFQRFVQDQKQDNSLQARTTDAMSDVEDANNAVTDEFPPAAESDLPLEIQEQLKLQAMEMLQAQLAVGDGPPDNSLPPTSQEVSSSTAAEYKQDAPSSASSQPAAASAGAGPPASLAASTAVVKSEPVAVSAAVAQGATPVKVEKAAANSVAKSTRKRSKKPKVVTPAVEDTTIADPMSIPLKNKAIHQWMMKDPDRLYTADDICKAGIRYRSPQSYPHKGIEKNKVYILNDYQGARKCLRERSSKKLWSWKLVGRHAGWKCNLAN